MTNLVRTGLAHERQRFAKHLLYQAKFEKRCHTTARYWDRTPVKLLSNLWLHVSQHHICHSSGLEQSATKLLWLWCHQWLSGVDSVNFPSLKPQPYARSRSAHFWTWSDKGDLSIGSTHKHFHCQVLGNPTASLSWTEMEPRLHA